MKHQMLYRAMAVISVVLSTSAAGAAPFNSGSTGVDGAFAPPTTVPPGTIVNGNQVTVPLPQSGIFNFTTVNIPSGVTVAFIPNSTNTPVTMLATGDVTIAGTVWLQGFSTGLAGTVGPNPGFPGGPGGFVGGSGGTGGQTNTDGAAGQGPGGGAAGIQGPPTTITGDGVYGADASFVGLIPLFGGSGGGGGGRGIGTSGYGGPGAGGGGAIVIASTTQIKVEATGRITANGGEGYRYNCDWRAGGAGSGGAIRLVAPHTNNYGNVEAKGGFTGCNEGGPGRIRIEAFVTDVIVQTNPPASIAMSPGPVTAASVPALINMPTLKITAINGVPTPSTSVGSYATADVSLPPGTSNPVTVTLTATNTPPGTPFNVKLIPQYAPALPPITGTFSGSTATVSLSLPPGQISVLNAWATLPPP